MQTTERYIPKKIRRQGLESKLTDEQRAILREWLKSHTYKETLSLMKQHFGITASMTSVCRWRASHCSTAGLAKDNRWAFALRQLRDEVSALDRQIGELLIEAEAGGLK